MAASGGEKGMAERITCFLIMNKRIILTNTQEGI
jgi:hypothetical protein